MHIDTTINLCGTSALPYTLALPAIQQNPTIHYLWSNGDTSAQPIIATAGTYTCHRSGACSASLADTITVHIAVLSTNPTLNLGADSSICQEHTFTLQAGSGFTSYLWSTGATSPSIPISQPATYWCTAANACGTQSDTVVYSPSQDFALDLPNQILPCLTSLPIAIAAPIAPASYLWSNGDTTQNTLLTHTGTYYLTASNGCVTHTDTFSISQNPNNILPNNIYLGADTSICTPYNQFGSITLQANAHTGNSILWSTGASTPSITINTPNTYYVTIGNACNQYISDTINITGCPAIAIDSIWLPNSFSPNADGLNDTWGIPYPKVQIIELEINIYNRWGNKVYTLHSPTDSWNGAGYSTGTYFYLLHYKDVLQHTHTQKGDIELIR